MRIFKKGKPSNIFGNNGITYGFFSPLMSLDGSFSKKSVKKQNLKKKLKTFFSKNNWARIAGNAPFDLYFHGESN